MRNVRYHSHKRRRQIGAWSHEPFGNDDASDWAYELEEARDLKVIESTLNKVLESEGYLETPQVACYHCKID